MQQPNDPSSQHPYRCNDKSQYLSKRRMAPSNQITLTLHLLHSAGAFAQKIK